MKTMTSLKRLSLILLFAGAVSCSGKQEGGQQGTVPQVREYQVVTLKPQDITLYKDYPATLQGKQTVEIRPKVAGYIDAILVDEGAFVRKGQVLFRLNANDIQASVRSAEAQVKVAEAEVVASTINLEKTKPLVEKDIISKFDLESAESTLKAREAQLAQAKANLENARANLQYTVITSPTDGIIGNFPYRMGSLVSSTIAQPLTTVSNTNEMYAYFAMNEKEFLALTNRLEGANLQQKLATLPGVQLALADNSLYREGGTIETASGLVDQQTGSVNVRATFPNSEGLLRSGSSGSVRIPQPLAAALIVPQNATFELQNKHFVYVVGAENKVRSTPVEVLSGNLKEVYVVTSGLNEGDQVVVEGIASLRNDMPIQPKLVEADRFAGNQAAGNQRRN
ncbi:efflux RND transporter periplasmic adaptor subunit [Gaoshiqia sp. Z1-71]|uniref:efflux RND transporter periplasmic adaptor subunit n=1 Tax=Gaoshiqia hydrogeniformans TaxID=3290090 RepID=UPI003BF85807